jgi:cyclophilin family peptidyl-prolyl cis-trans isomerase
VTNSARGIFTSDPAVHAHNLHFSVFAPLLDPHPVTDNTFLDWFEPSTDASHPVFGRIMENFNLVLQMSQVSTRNDNPVLPIRVISVRVK